MVCTICGKSDSETEFYTHANGRIRSRCKKCYVSSQLERIRFSKEPYVIHSVDTSGEKSIVKKRKKKGL